MNSIKSNPFVSALVAITVVLCGALFYLASSGGTRYEEAKAAFDESYASVSNSESIALYPTLENRNGKEKALKEYRQSIAELSGLFDKFRPGKLENTSPQVFGDRLKQANRDITKAFAAAGCELPEKFYLGFETYSGGLAREEATGALGFQLDGISHALLGLAEAGPSELIRIHRVTLPEENGGNFNPGPNAVARNFPVEMTFKSSESAAREFLSFLGATDKHYYVVRCIKIANERDTPPKVSDAKFEDDRPAAAVAPQAADPFAFFAPDESPEDPDEPAPAEGEEQPAPDAEEAPAEAVDSTRILAQVLGNEEVIVFVRFDVSMFLPAKELPKP
ncbi:hypothetical protein HZ994_05565 [Akkermansiaceae bacterium]|nr:hypothetical protein HZ994_05565 [Akkermansiaceae bacterium]